MEQHDGEILESDRLRTQQTSSLATFGSPQNPFLLDRFIQDNKNASPQKTSRSNSIKSMQHFFLKVL